MEPRTTGEKGKKRAWEQHSFIFIGIGLCALVWVADPIVDVLVFGQGQLLQQFLKPDTVEIYFRSLVSAVIIVFSIFIQSTLNRRRQAEAVLQETKRYLDRLIGSSTDAIIATDKEGTITFFSPGAKDMLGWVPEDILGRYVVELYESEEKAKETSRLMRLNDGTVSGHETNLRAKDGSLVPVLISASFLYDEDGQEAGTVGFSKDITERKQTEKKIIEQREFLESILESLSHPFYVIDVDDYKIIAANSAARESYGGESEGMTCHALIHKRSDPCGDYVHPCPLEEAKKTKSHVTVEHVHYDKKGNMGVFEVHSHPIFDSEGNVVQVIQYSFDVTERKEMEQELRHADKLAAIGRLAAGATHEILNPLNIIKIILHMATQDPNVPKGVVEDLKDADAQVARIDKITSNLLHFSRQSEPERRQVGINEIVEGALSLLSHDLKLQDIELNLCLDEELPPVLLDEDQMKHVVLHLLNNACDAMPEGGKLTLGAKTICNDDQPFLELRVEDTGHGIAPTNMDKLFEPFFTTKPVGRGTGLGLSTCQGIVESHGGRIWAEQVPAGGAVFVVRLPLEDE